ncbi:MAG TPA: DCC1-like thiol-disulfide oxidoreductase family protein [Draconibacterium sp.]|nr:DCC1-like thiol-disulfide oxidoreductase family protein [Draconibacterium sp.]
MHDKNNIVLFDGICNLCNVAVDFVLKRDTKKQFRYVSIQSEEGQNLIARFKIPEELDSVILLKEEIAFFESEAAIEIGKMLPVPWKWAGIFRIVPLKIRNGIYRWIARNRYRWFGKRDQCRIIQN